MDLHLQGKCALVCAASKGLGRASAMALAREGAAVAISARTRDPLDAAAAGIQAATGTPVHAIVADVSRAGDIDRLVSESVARLGGLDILITNTGGPPSAPFETLTDADWQAAIDSLLLSAVRLSRAVLPHMRQRGGGRIIHVTSISVKQPIEGLVLSNALRGAVAGLSKTLALELARDHILVNCVAPGYTRTGRVIELAEATASREGTSAEVVQKRTEATIPLARMGTPEEFGAAVAFLASAGGDYVTGATIQVDGGLTRAVL
jgi:3-oxoacyl-[acyl-carrier protein] reductase